MKHKNEKLSLRNYGSESVNIKAECCKYLLENNYFENDKKKNIELLEKALINYSVLKLADWNPNYEKLGIQDWDNLSIVLEVLNNQIPSKQERDNFFIQYIHCILLIYSIITKEEPIQWTRRQETQNTLVYILNERKIEEMITGDDFPLYIIPGDLINNIKTYYSQEKNPVLKK